MYGCNAAGAQMARQQRPPCTIARMSAHTATANPANVIDLLYQDALGASGGAHYAAPFTRFETLGRTRTSWNWAAALCTLGWLLYRRLWSEALLYTGLLQGLLLLWFALLRPWLAPAQPIELGLGLALLCIACTLPGLWGDALVYRDVRQRTLAALDQAPTLAQARAQLQQQAPGRLRATTIAALHLALLGALLTAALWQAPPAYELIGHAEPAQPASPPPASAAEPSPAAQPAPEPAAALPVPEPAPAPEPSPPEPTAPAALPAPAPPSTRAVEKAPPKAPKDKPKEASKETPKAKPKASAKKSAPEAESESAPLQAQRHYITVGVFSDQANAQKVQKQLQKARLPVQVQTVGTNKGERIRVRAGPFRQAQEADKAAQRIRDLGLEAVVFHPR